MHPNRHHRLRRRVTAGAPPDKLAPMTRGDAVAHAGLPAAWSHVLGVLPGTVLAGAGLVAAATVAGA